MQGPPTVRPREHDGIAVIARARGISQSGELYQEYDTTSRTSKSYPSLQCDNPPVTGYSFNALILDCLNMYRSQAGHPNLRFTGQLSFQFHSGCSNNKCVQKISHPRTALLPTRVISGSIASVSIATVIVGRSISKIQFARSDTRNRHQECNERKLTG